MLTRQAGLYSSGGAARTLDRTRDASARVGYAAATRAGWPHAAHAVLLPLAALSLQMWLDAHGPRVPLLLLYPAGLISAFLGGLRWGLAANLWSTGLAWYHLAPRMTTDDPWLLGGIVLSTLGVLWTARRRHNRPSAQRRSDTRSEAPLNPALDDRAAA